MTSDSVIEVFKRLWNRTGMDRVPIADRTRVRWTQETGQVVKRESCS